MNTGIKSWLNQRITAVYLAFYTLFIMVYLIKSTALHYEAWHALFTNPLMSIATLLAILSVGVHAWIGLWTVATDYIKNSFIRILFLSFVIFLLAGYVAWGIKILWGSIA